MFTSSEEVSGGTVPGTNTGAPLGFVSELFKSAALLDTVFAGSNIASCCCRAAGVPAFDTDIRPCTGVRRVEVP